MITEEQRYEQARRRVKEKKRFYSHLTTYLVMGAFFFLLNFVTSPGHWWFYWPMLGWGIGVAIQYFKVFGLPGSGAGSSDWENREIEKEMRKMESGRKRLPPKRKSSSVDIDDHLELREIQKQRSKEPSYRKDDLV